MFINTLEEKYWKKYFINEPIHNENAEGRCPYCGGKVRKIFGKMKCSKCKKIIML